LRSIIIIVIIIDLEGYCDFVAAVVDDDDFLLLMVVSLLVHAQHNNSSVAFDLRKRPTESLVLTIPPHLKQCTPSTN
jgi:hypothetical protein